MSAEILLALAAFLLGVLGWEVIQQKRLTQRERDLLDESADKAAGADKEKVQREHDDSRSKSGSDWFSGWRK